MKNPGAERPMVHAYGMPIHFLKDLLAFYKARGNFSLRQRTKLSGACSQALVSQILQGKRQLKRDNLRQLAVVFKLSVHEVKSLDQKIGNQKSAGPITPERVPQNHLLHHWVNPFIKDLVHLKGFEPQTEVIAKMIGGIVRAAQIEKSIQFLLEQGFWRKTLQGKIEPNENAVTTTQEIPNEKIRSFHKKALTLAAKGIDQYSVDERKAATVLISVHHEKIEELKMIFDEFHSKLNDFIEAHPQGDDVLFQITTHMTPIGRANE